MHDGTFGTFKTSRKERVDIRVGVMSKTCGARERRRRWSRKDKLRIVRQSLEPNAVVTDVARRNEVSASLIYVWRRQALAGLMEGFQRVEVVEETSLPMIEADAPPTASIVPASRDAPMTGPPAPRPSIEVTLPGGVIVRIDSAADAKTLRAVLGALVER